MNLNDLTDRQVSMVVKYSSELAIEYKEKNESLMQIINLFTKKILLEQIDVEQARNQIEAYLINK